MPSILSDFHHEDLYYSLQLLFEKRLGYTLYRQIGIEWRTNGFWNVFDHPATANQFLSIDNVPDGPHRDWKNLNGELIGDVYIIPSRQRDFEHKAVTLEVFKNMKFDILLCTIPQHFPMWQRLKELYQPQAKVIFQMGNHWGIPSGVQNLLNSTSQDKGSVPNEVKYHQEFPLGRYCWTPPTNPKRIINLKHLMNPNDKRIFETLNNHLSDYEFIAYGAGNKDAEKSPANTDEVIKPAGFIFHVKEEGDGYGYNCLDDKTEILTETGWKYIKDVSYHDKVSDIVDGTTLTFSTPIDIIHQKFNGNLIHFNTAQVDIMVTPNHRMYIERYDKNAKSKGWRIETANTLAFMKPYYPSRAIGIKMAPDFWTKETESNELITKAKFMGWYLSEGCCSTYKYDKINKKRTSNNNVSISQVDRCNTAEIIRLCRKLRYKIHIRKTTPKNSIQQQVCITISNKELANELYIYGKSDKKYIPLWIKNGSKSIISAFIECYMRGDGCKESKTFSRIVTVSKQMADDLQECITKLGHRSRITSQNPKGYGKLKSYRVSMSTGPNRTKIYHPPKYVSYNGLVHCVSVSSGIILTRRNGITAIVGNCFHTAAIGRPIITRISHYKNKHASEFMIDNVTCIDLDNGSLLENAARIRKFSEPEEYNKMCENMYRTFKQNVNFDKDELEIRKFIEQLI